MPFGSSVTALIISNLYFSVQATLKIVPLQFCKHFLKHFIVKGNKCSICCTAGILSSSKSPLGDDFRASRTNCYCGDWVLHVVLPLTSCDFCSQILSVYERSIKVFSFLVVFT